MKWACRLQASRTDLGTRRISRKALNFHTLPRSDSSLTLPAYTPMRFATSRPVPVSAAGIPRPSNSALTSDLVPKMGWPTDGRWEGRAQLLVDWFYACELLP